VTTPFAAFAAIDWSGAKGCPKLIAPGLRGTWLGD